MKLCTHKISPKSIQNIITACMSLVSFSFANEYNTASNSYSDSTTDFLYEYGQYIYKRENCGYCHTLNIAVSSQKISLDGLKGKYSYDWHYYHLLDPRSLNIQSNMPAYANLAEGLFIKDSVSKHLGSFSETAWFYMVNKSQEVREELKKKNISIGNNSEMLALIWFLDNIPETEAFKADKAAKNLILANEQRVYDSLWNELENTVSFALKDSLSLEKGKMIFQQKCKLCHGNLAEGLIGPDLTDKYWLYGNSTFDIASTISKGVPDRGMPPWHDLLNPIQV